MQTVTYRKLIVLTVLFLVISPLVLQGNAVNHQATLYKTSNTSATNAASSILTVDRRINNTEVEVNQSIIVELILTNTGDSPVYNINLTEKSLANPEILTNNLISPMLFAKFEAHEKRVITYTIVSHKMTNMTLEKTVVTYQQINSPNAAVYTSYSTPAFIIVKPLTVSGNTLNLNNLLVVSFIAVLYSVILALRIFFKIIKKSKS